MTGEDVRLPIGIAVVLMLTGATLLLVDRSRRRPVAASGTSEDDRPTT